MVKYILLSAWLPISIQSSGGFRLRPGRPRPTHSVDRPTHWKLRPTLRGSNISFCDEAQKCQNDIFVAFRYVSLSSKYIWGRHPLPLPSPLDAEGVVSISAPHLSGLPTQIPGYAYGLPNFFLAYPLKNTWRRPDYIPKFKKILASCIF